MLRTLRIGIIATRADLGHDVESELLEPGMKRLLRPAFDGDDQAVQSALRQRTRIKERRTDRAGDGAVGVVRCGDAARHLVEASLSQSLT
jgi:hypothetical protein